MGLFLCHLGEAAVNAMGRKNVKVLLFADVAMECRDDKLFRFYLKALTSKTS